MVDFNKFYAAVLGASGLRGVSEIDTPSLDNLLVDSEIKALLVANTTSFLSGKKAQNVLLWGAKGCGKSSLLKAIFACFYTQGLRVVQVGKERLSGLDELLALLRKESNKFIIFCDDLSFEFNDDSYKMLKPLLEGGIELPPKNVLIYATSNYRHLVAERARVGLDDIYYEAHLSERLSLCERFGISQGFCTPSVSEYLAIVQAWLSEPATATAGASEPIKWDEKLGREAIVYATQRGGRSGRVARQFAELVLSKAMKI